MKDKIKIIIVDDHQIVIDGLKLLLSDNETVEVIFETTKAKFFLDQINELEYDILITDLMMPEIDGVELTKQVRIIRPETKIIVLSMNSDGLQAYQLIHELNVQAYVLKTIGKIEFNKAINIVSNGGIYYSEEVLEQVERYEKIRNYQKDINLTHRELEIIQCISEDLTNKQIASKLFISERTVETHRKNILRKTDTHSIVSLLEFAKKYQILK